MPIQSRVGTCPPVVVCCVFSNLTSIPDLLQLEGSQGLQESQIHVKKYDVKNDVRRTDFRRNDNPRVLHSIFCEFRGITSFNDMEIRISIPRPLLLLTIVGIVVLWSTGTLSFRLPGTQLTGQAVGGQSTSQVVTDAQKSFDRESVKRAVLEQKEEILRYELLELEKRIDAASTEEEKQHLHEVRASLLSIIREKNSVEELMTQSLLAMWEAEGVNFTTDKQVVSELLDWPVKPLLGISAFFRDEGYKKRFGFDHNAIDIPVEQGATILSPAAGTVKTVSLNGLGYSYVTIQHAGGLETTYGHISGSLVQEGDTVTRGQAIAFSGGEPGSQGAGMFTTGPHLHFVTKVNDVLVDPLQFLPPIKGVTP